MFLFLAVGSSGDDDLRSFTYVAVPSPPMVVNRNGRNHVTNFERFYVFQCELCIICGGFVGEGVALLHSLSLLRSPIPVA